MSLLDPEAMLGAFTLEGARVAVLGYDADARAHALALRRAGNTVVIGLPPGAAAWPEAARDAFAVDRPAAAVANAELVVVRAHEDGDAWRHCEPRIAAGALVVFACARALMHGSCARSGMDVVLVTGVEDARVGCRIGVHRDVTRRALVRAVAYARAAFGAGATLRSTSIAEEAELEVASSGERAGHLLALAASSPRLPPRPAPAPAWNADDEPAPAALDDAGWFYAMLNRRGGR